MNPLQALTEANAQLHREIDTINLRLRERAQWLQDHKIISTARVTLGSPFEDQALRWAPHDGLSIVRVAGHQVLDSTPIAHTPLTVRIRALVLFPKLIDALQAQIDASLAELEQSQEFHP